LVIATLASAPPSRHRQLVPVRASVQCRARPVCHQRPAVRCYRRSCCSMPVTPHLILTSFRDGSRLVQRRPRLRGRQQARGVGHPASRRAQPESRNNLLPHARSTAQPPRIFSVSIARPKPGYKQRTWRRPERLSKQSATNSVPNWRSHELWRETARERPKGRYGGKGQSGAFAEKPATIGLSGLGRGRRDCLHKT
jgi:hypothetical protein